MQIHRYAAYLTDLGYRSVAARTHREGLSPRYRLAAPHANAMPTYYGVFIELKSHPFYIGTLFVPQAISTEENPHPLVSAFVRQVAAGPSHQT